MDLIEQLTTIRNLVIKYRDNPTEENKINIMLFYLDNDVDPVDLTLFSIAIDNNFQDFEISLAYSFFHLGIDYVSGNQITQLEMENFDKILNDLKQNDIPENEQYFIAFKHLLYYKNNLYGNPLNLNDTK